MNTQKTIRNIINTMLADVTAISRYTDNNVKDFSKLDQFDKWRFEAFVADIKEDLRQLLEVTKQ